MAPPSSTVSVWLVSVLTLLTPAAGQKCPPEYCSFCLPEVVYCSGLSLEVTSDSLNYILIYLQRPMGGTLKEFLLQSANVRDLRGTQIGASLPKLTQLSIIKCDIAFINENTFKGLTKLTDLSLRNNSFKNFSFAHLNPIKTVQIFDLSSNSIMHVENPAKTIFPEMLELNVGDNQLSFIENDFFSNFPNLHKLVLRNNPLQNLTHLTFGGLGNLSSLDLSNTQLVSIADACFYGLFSLRSLDLGHSMNTMTEQNLNLKFRGLGSLKRLTLRDNAIQKLPHQFLIKERRFRVLQYLDLSQNNITRIENRKFSSLRNLQILKLSNMLSPMLPIPSSAFTGLFNLTYLDLQGNNLTMLPLAAIEPVKFAKISLAYGNNFLCNCSLLHLKRDIINGLLKTDIQCRINVEKIFLSQMTDEDLGCTAPSLNGGRNETVVYTTVGSIALILCNASSMEEFPQLTFHAVDGNPLPYNKFLVQTNKTITIMPYGRKQFTTSAKISVENVDKENSGLVVCSGNTTYGKSESFVLLHIQEQKSSTNNWTIGVVTSLVTILVVIIVIAVAITWQQKRNRERRLEDERRRNVRRTNSLSSNESNSARENNSAETPAVPQPVISETSL
ncbi:leucine-rich repeat-containing protein 70-like [Lineus longissimus]|uniref:leucine-rich repeat-containing protein 70-like n=1 Tax=Lineus longissimus TaxID=88925 RepID=UPI00315CEB3A